MAGPTLDELNAEFARVEHENMLKALRARATRAPRTQQEVELVAEGVVLPVTPPQAMSEVVNVMTPPPDLPYAPLPQPRGARTWCEICGLTFSCLRASTEKMRKTLHVKQAHGGRNAPGPEPAARPGEG